MKICGKQTGPGFAPHNILPCQLEDGHEGFCQRPDGAIESKRIVLVVENGACVPSENGSHLYESMARYGIRALVLRVWWRNDSIPIELFDLSRLPDGDLNTVENLIKEYSKTQGRGKY